MEIANLEPPHLGESIILPKVPYKAAVLAVNGTAHYHNFGRFLASPWLPLLLLSAAVSGKEDEMQAGNGSSSGLLLLP